jgi:hypothetical protein
MLNRDTKKAANADSTNDASKQLAEDIKQNKWNAQN